MATVSDLVRPVIARLEGVPEPTAAMEYIKAAREFLRKTEAWRDVVVPSFVVTNEYSLAASSAEAQVFTVKQARYNDSELYPLTREQMLRLDPATGTPRYYRTVGNTLFIAPDPGNDVSADLLVSVAMRPVNGASSLDDWLADEFGEIFEWGALARLMSMPKKPWTDLDLAAFYGGMFREQIEEWQTLGSTEGHVGVPRKVRYGGL